MSSLNHTAQRLQLALSQRGRNISWNSRQFFSTTYNKLVTCHKLKENGELLLKTYSIAEVVQTLAALYREELNGDG